MSVQTLHVLAANRIMGRVERDARGRLGLIYDEEWRSTDAAFPLSLSMPLAASEHGHAAVEAFLWGLLPDNERVLDRWATTFQVSPRNPFALIAHVGEDCAGAVQFSSPERLRVLLEGKPSAIAWLDEADVAQRLRELREDHAAWRRPHDTGQFSLAGAQPKTALYIDGDRIGIPSGRTPTTHILKPPTADFDGHVENEHFCLELARALGLPAASSEVRRFRREVAIVIERYDRLRTADVEGLETLAKTQPILRVHQEDCCQALGKPPTLKYQSDGGPTPEDIVALLRQQSSDTGDDVARFVDALAFNWLIGGTDAHAKNYSLLLGARGMVRLAPLYDVASALPYTNFDPRRIELAMKVGGSYRVADIGLRHWHKLVTALRLDADRALARIAELAAELPDQANGVRERVRRDGLEHPILDRLASRLTTRARHCARQLERGG